VRLRAVGGGHVAAMEKSLEVVSDDYFHLILVGKCAAILSTHSQGSVGAGRLRRRRKNVVFVSLQETAARPDLGSPAAEGLRLTQT